MGFGETGQRVAEVGGGFLGGLPVGAGGAKGGAWGEGALTSAETSAATPPQNYGVAFFGETSLKYYTGSDTTLGAPGRNFFFMPIEDSGAVTDAASAARYTGMSPSTLEAYKTGGDIYGISFPTDDLTFEPPTTADAAGWPHFLEGGNTAVLTGDGPNAGYFVNPTHEFLTPGGDPMPSGSTLFQLGSNGEWIPLKTY